MTGMITRAALRAALALGLGVGLAIAAEPSARPFVLLDPTGEPVASARVAVVGRTGSVATDAAGRFRLDPEPAPPFELAIFDARGTFLGVVRVEASKGSRDVRLPEPPSADVEVRAGIAPSTAASPAAAATLVSRTEIDRLQPERIVDILREIPGTGRIEEGASGVPVLRGMARGRTLILLDDARVTAERRAGPSATYLDPASIESLEVVLGPGSVAYGSDAIGGVVHARTPAPTPGSTSGRVEAGAGVGTPFAAGSVEANLPVGAGALLVQARARSYDDYAAPSGDVFDSSSDDRGILVRGLHPIGGARLQWGVRVDAGRDIGKPAASSRVERAYYPTEDASRFNLGVDFGPRGGFSSVELQAFAGRYRLETIRDRAASDTTTRRIRQSSVDADDASLRLVATRPFREGFVRFGFDGAARLGLRADGSTQSYDAAGAVTETLTERSVESAGRVDAALFAEGERRLTGRLSLMAGLRADRVRTRNEGGYFGDRSRAHSAISGHVASVVRSRDGAIETTFQMARGFREPSLSDLYFRGVTGRGFATGNPELDPESSLHADLTVRARVGRAHLAGSVYAFRVDDLVERYASGDDFLFTNRARENVRGAEFEAAIRLRERLTARVAASALRGRIDPDDTPAADVPPHRLVVGLEQEIGRWWWRGSLLATRRKDDPGNIEIATPGFIVLDLGAGVELSTHVGLRVAVLNALDKEYPGSPDPDAALAPGRSVSVTLSSTFGGS